MKYSLTIIAAAAFATAVAVPALAGSVGIQAPRNSATESETIAQLQVAAVQATTDGRNGNKNNIEFARKNYEINQLVARLESGQQVGQSEIDRALDPARVW